DRERLHRRAGQTALDRTLEQPGAGFSRLARRTEGPAAGDLLEHDPASALAVTLAEQPQRRLDPLRVVVRRDSQILDRQGLRATTSSASTTRARRSTGLALIRRS